MRCHHDEVCIVRACCFQESLCGRADGDGHAGLKYGLAEAPSDALESL
jgi:hypothetical protein